LYLSVFEQPASRVFFIILIGIKTSRRKKQSLDISGQFVILKNRSAAVKEQGVW